MSANSISITGCREHDLGAREIRERPGSRKRKAWGGYSWKNVWNSILIEFTGPEAEKMLAVHSHDCLHSSNFTQWSETCLCNNHSCDGGGEKKKRKGESLSRVWPFATPWTAAHQPPLSMGFSRQEYWSGCYLVLFLYSTYKWYNIVFVFLCLTYFTLYNDLQVHPCCFKWQNFILFYGWVLSGSVSFPASPYLMCCFCNHGCKTAASPPNTGFIFQARKRKEKKNKPVASNFFASILRGTAK